MKKFQINRRQAVLLFVICTISSKLQALPCLIAGDIGKDLWLVLFLCAAVDMLFLYVTILINKLCPNMTVHDMIRTTYGKIVSTIIGILFLAYFICKAVIPYEAVRDVFASNLFDTLPWQIFSIFLLICVGYLAYSGMRCIGRTAELYFYLLLPSVVLLILMGLFTAPLQHILPLFENPFSKIAECGLTHSIWFGDYMIFYVLIGRIKPNETGLKYKDLLIYAGAILIYAIAYISLYSLYTVLTPTQTSLLSSISAFALINLEIGRIDWFLVLISQIASIISCATYVYCTTDCINQLTGKKRYNLCLILTIIILYITDLSLFSNIDAGTQSFRTFTSYGAIILQTAVPLLCLIAAFICKKRNKIQKVGAI